MIVSYIDYNLDLNGIIFAILVGWVFLKKPSVKKCFYFPIFRFFVNYVVHSYQNIDMFQKNHRLLMFLIEQQFDRMFLKTKKKLKRFVLLFA